MPDSHTWKGYARQDGRIGIRNRLLVIYTVECAAHVAREIALRAHHPEVECVGFSRMHRQSIRDPAFCCR